MKFETYESEKSGEVYFRLKAGNGEIILASEGYKSRSSCKAGIESVMKNCTDDSCYEKKISSNGKWHFNLKAGNGQVIGSSQLYKDEASMLKGIESVKKAGNATVSELAD